MDKYLVYDRLVYTIPWIVYDTESRVYIHEVLKLLWQLTFHTFLLCVYNNNGF